jgi:hypothetical protein
MHLLETRVGKMKSCVKLWQQSLKWRGYLERLYLDLRIILKRLKYVVKEKDDHVDRIRMIIGGVCERDSYPSAL